MNASWHRLHVMKRNATLDERVAWHRAHARACGCRGIPPTVKARMDAKKGR